MRWSALLVLALLAPAEVSAADMITGQAEVVDGDGLTIGPVRIRLHGIDAPELGQRCAERGGGTWQCDEAAANRLEDLIGESAVSCEPLDSDAYGRIIARCTANGADVAAVLASEGLVWAFRRYSEDYAEAEEAARDEGMGIWQASTEPPWDYRADRWERAAEQAPDGCPIKGNINSEEERIYHTPWSPWYGRTKIFPSMGERWFCNEAEALEAGWRPARFR